MKFLPISVKQKKPRISLRHLDPQLRKKLERQKAHFPLKLAISAHGRTVVVLDRERAGGYLRPQLLGLLGQTESMTQLKSISTQRQQAIDYTELAASYFELINSGICKNQAAVAKYLGVSRAWVTKGLKQ